MALENWIFYILTVFALMSTPGPSQLLMLTNSSSHGFIRSTATMAGDLTANAFQMLASALGISALLVVYGEALSIIKWLGVFYLIWLGFKMIRKANPKAEMLNKPIEVPLFKTLWFQGFITSAANPKAVVFFTALFLQFIQPEYGFWPQMLILSITYIIIDGIFLSIYGVSASYITSRFKGDTKVWIERVGGIFMILAAFMLSLKSM